MLDRSSVDSMSSATAAQAHRAMDDCDQVSASQKPEPTNRDLMRMLQTVNESRPYAYAADCQRSTDCCVGAF